MKLQVYGTAPLIEPTEVQKGLFLSLIEEDPDKEARLHPFILAWVINLLTAIPPRSFTNEQISIVEHHDVFLQYGRKEAELHFPWIQNYGVGALRSPTIL